MTKATDDASLNETLINHDIYTTRDTIHHPVRLIGQNAVPTSLQTETAFSVAVLQAKKPPGPNLTVTSLRDFFFGNKYSAERLHMVFDGEYFERSFVEDLDFSNGPQSYCNHKTNDF